MSGSPYPKVEDVAELLGCSKRIAHKRARLAETPHRKPPGARRLLFLEAEVRAWLDGAPRARPAPPWQARPASPRRPAEGRLMARRRWRRGHHQSGQ